jgi:hypothetical protein
MVWITDFLNFAVACTRRARFRGIWRNTGGFAARNSTSEADWDLGHRGQPPRWPARRCPASQAVGVLTTLAEALLIPGELTSFPRRDLTSALPYDSLDTAGHVVEGAAIGGVLVPRPSASMERQPRKVRRIGRISLIPKEPRIGLSFITSWSRLTGGWRRGPPGCRTRAGIPNRSCNPRTAAAFQGDRKPGTRRV